MTTITVVLVLLLAVVVSGWLSRSLPPAIPRPLVQIALGGVVGLVSGLRVELNPDVFFLLFLPPLLFLDGWRIPKEEMLRDATTILELAFGLVIFTVLGIGLFIQWMVPAIPLPVAFALAAVLSPTDPIAVSSIAARIPIPKRLMHILEGESLLNDASGLVCLRFAVAAALTGSFSPSEAALSFLWVVAGGIAVGTLVTRAITRLEMWVAHRVGEESGTQIILSLLIPFGSYLLAEHVHCSGILAAVTAGITMSYADAQGPSLASTRLQRTTVWDTIQFAANGIIFVLLGEQLPGLLRSAARTVDVTGHDNPAWLIVYVLAITAALAGLRLAWVYISLNFTIYRASLRGKDMRHPPWQLVVATSLAGTRGAITLAGVLTLPLTLQDGSPFPARDLAILLAMGVIMVSLVAASIGLPLLLSGLRMPVDHRRTVEEDLARTAAAQAAILAVERAQHDPALGHSDVDALMTSAVRVVEYYRSRIDHRSGDGEVLASSRRREAAEKDMILAALRAERDTVAGLLEDGTIGSETARRLMREIDLLELRYDGDGR